MSKIKNELEELKSSYKSQNNPYIRGYFSENKKKLFSTNNSFSFLIDISGGSEMITFNFVAGDLEMNYTLIPNEKYPSKEKEKEIS